MKSTGILLVILLGSNFLGAQSSDQEYVKDFVQCTFNLSEVMLHDVVNPPAASRFYAYAILGAYKTGEILENDASDFSQYFNAPLKITSATRPEPFNESFSSMYAMLEVGKLLMPSGYLLEEKQSALVNQYRKKHKISKKVLEENIKYAEKVASQVVNYAKTDGYSKLSAFKRYKPVKEEGHWYPTPPEYMPPVEPEWRTIRPFLLDSAQQFVPADPVAFDKSNGSLFYKQMQEVYVISKNLSLEQKNIAAFWDCNPFAVSYSGHLAIGLKKISPGGHWISITGIACRNSDASFKRTVYAHALVAITLHDAFISCWHEKYTTDRIRPESAINKLIDPAWHPLLQTPPFPEYTSGHSVISTASSEILSDLFGFPFTFKDTSEEYFGLPAREFNSFREAANEAAISRIYGGIHFRDAIEAGQEQGRAIGNFILKKIKSQKNYE